MELYYMFGSFWFWVFLIHMLWSHYSIKSRISALEKQVKECGTLHLPLSTEKLSMPTSPEKTDEWGEAVAAPAETKTSTPVKTVPEHILSDEEKSGKLLGRIGVGALLVGVSFFLKYSFDNGWIGPSGLIAIGIVAGLAMVVMGQVLRKKYTSYADIVIGGGIGILYLSIYSAFGFYSLIAAPVAFGCMIIVTLLAIVMSIVGESCPLAALGFVGGFVTPMLIASVRPDFWTLLPYILVLDIGVFVIAYYKRWAYLNFIGFIGTYLLFGSWAVDAYTKDMMLPVMIFAAIFFAIYLLTSVAHHIVRREKSHPEDFLLITANAVVFTFISYAVLYLDFKMFSGFYAVMMALIYFGIAYFARTTLPEDTGLNWYLPAISIVFLTIAIPLQFDSQMFIAFAWLVESMFLYMLAFNLRVASVRQCAFIVYCIGILSWLTNLAGFYMGDPTNVAYILLRIILGIIAVLVTAMIAYQYRLHEDQIAGDGAAESASKALVVVANVLTVILVTTEINQFYARQNLDNSQLALTTVSIFWALYAIGALLIGIKRRVKMLRVGGLMFFFVTIFKVIIDVWSLGDLYRIVSFITVGAIALIGSFIYLKYKDRFKELV